MEILKLYPVGKDYLWGGTRLREEYGKKIELIPLAETWECSTHPDGLSKIANGKFKGMSLAEVLKRHPEYLGTKVARTDTGNQAELPILIKFIDTKKDLSIQVHPDDEYARYHENQSGKSEMWYILDAEKGASLIYGFRHAVSSEILKKAIKTGTLDKHLQRVEVHKEETYYVPAGTVHGIGAGILLVEVQENSNVTYRVYDYNRIDKDGKMRKLHFDEAIKVMNMNAEEMLIKKTRIVRYYPGYSKELLCRCKYFETERIRIAKKFSFDVQDSSFQVIICLEGSGVLEHTEEKRRNLIWFQKGETMFLPAGIGECWIKGKVELLKVRC